MAKSTDHNAKMLGRGKITIRMTKPEYMRITDACVRIAHAPMSVEDFIEQAIAEKLERHGMLHNQREIAQLREKAELALARLDAISYETEGVRSLQEILTPEHEELILERQKIRREYILEENALLQKIYDRSE